MNFGEVLSRAWEIIWKNKILWVFGILAALGSGSGSSGNSGSNFRFEGGEVPPQFQGIERFFENIQPWMIVLFVLGALLFTVLIVVLSTFGKGGLLRGAWLADGGETGFTFGRLWGEGGRYFLRLFLLGLLIFFGTLVLVFVIFVPGALLSAITMGIGLICFLPLICLMIPVFIALGVVVNLAMIAIVGEDLGVMDGLRRGWEVFRSHLGEIIGIGLILVIGVAVANFIIGLPVLLIALPMIGGFLDQSGRFTGAGITTSIVLFLLYLPFLLALSGIVQSYFDTAWTVTFRRLTGRGSGTTGDLSAVRVYDLPA